MIPLYLVYQTSLLINHTRYFIFFTKQGTNMESFMNNISKTINSYACII